EESADEAHARFSAAIDRALARHPTGTLAVVTHGTVMALFVARATGQEPFALWRRLQRLGTPAVVALPRPRLEVLALEGVDPEP
ncbi:MAG: histidine phosphatase family protein, partial [Thermomicrobiaceae bacterium]|nr:histidine phosphatase family protein [Thermomicrobiaceae bacterium]